MKKDERFILASTLTGFGIGLFNGDARTEEAAKTDFLDRRSQRSQAEQSGTAVRLIKAKVVPDTPRRAELHEHEEESNGGH